MRFRHKLSIVLIALLVLVPLVATGLLVQSSSGRNQTDAVDGSLSATVSGAAVAYRSELEPAARERRAIAQDRPDVQQAMRRRQPGRPQPAVDRRRRARGDRERRTSGPGDSAGPGRPGRPSGERRQQGQGHRVRAAGRGAAAAARRRRPRADEVDLALTVDGEITGSTGGRTGDGAGAGRRQADDDGRRRVGGAGAGRPALEGPPRTVPAEILADLSAVACWTTASRLAALRLLLALGLLGRVLIALACWPPTASRGADATWPAAPRRSSAPAASRCPRAATSWRSWAPRWT